MNKFAKILLMLVIVATIGNLVGQVMLWAPPVTDNNIADGGNNQENESSDNEAEIPSVNVHITAIVIPGEDNKITDDVVFGGESASITVPAGVQMVNGATELTLTVDNKSDAEAALDLTDDDISVSLDVHVDGIDTTNSVPMEITLNGAVSKGLNSTSIRLFHVENGETVEMTRVELGAAFTAHNQFKYDPATGDVVLSMASFSEVAIVRSLANAWTGEVDHSWYKPDTNKLTIANAEQLWSFSQIVGGMAKDKNGNYVVNITSGENVYHYDDFSGKTVKLIADINLADDEAHDDESKIFYPIGYYSSDEKYEKTQVAVTTGFRLFKGIFDGSGHTISNFYQDTWSMKGDHNWYDATLQYYRDGMGLFGRIYGGTVMNLTVKNFSSDGEISTTGTIAAYADHGATFENIAIQYCNPRVYNIGNGGIVGCVGWYNKGVTDAPVTFRNITVDNTNKISALWGSWDVACGGIVGQYYPTSGQSSAGYPENAGIYMENCHVGAQIDVNNDVCANYQYYAYRYAGMLIGSVDENETIDGHVYPKMDGITAKDCTVHFGTWNDYYYCELVVNSLASYTHDHQMSRLTQVASVEGKTVTPLNGKSFEVPSEGSYNYVVVNGEHADENATCYHFVDGEVWTHDKAGTEIVDGKEVLKEDKQHIYLEFNNLVTGNGWGVTSKGIDDMDGVTILDKSQANSVEKFEEKQPNGKKVYPISGRVYKLSHLFNELNTEYEIIPGAIMVNAVNIDDSSSVTIDFERNLTSWGDSTVVFGGKGRVRITIQDYYYCEPTTIEFIVRNYPEGSEIYNFTYDGFTGSTGNYEFDTSADYITNGKHGTYFYDFGFGPEELQYAYKMDSKGGIKFVAKDNGTIAIAIASLDMGTGLTMNGKDLVKIRETNTLVVVNVDVTKGQTYTFKRITGECAVYYIGYLPSSAASAEHDCVYFSTTTATCDKDGVTTYTCLVCTNSYKENTKKFGHNIVVDEAYDSTCNEEGRTEGSHCTNCDEKTVKQNKVNKKAHSYQNGICTVCGDLGNTVLIDPNNSYKIDFTTGNVSDYSNYGSGKYFKPYGKCNIDTTNKYLIMSNQNEDNTSYIEFTVNGPTYLIVVATSTGRGNTSRFALLNSAGGTVNEINGRTYASGASNTTFVFRINAAGTYRFVCNEPDRVGRIKSMQIGIT